MKDVIVVAGCTHKEGLVDQYAEQLRSAGIEFHLADYAPMPDGPNSLTMRRRIGFLREMTSRFSDYQYIYATDAWDVLFLGTKETLLENSPDCVMCAAERNCYPESHLAPMIDGRCDSPWRYANAGLIGGPVDMVRGWCDAAEAMGDLDILDQGWLNRRLAEGNNLVIPDVHTRVFYVASSWLEDGALQAKDGRLWNSEHDTFPSFFHFSGKCSTDMVCNLLSN